MSQVPGFIAELAAGDEILAEYLNGLARAANLQPVAADGYVDPDTAATTQQAFEPIIHVWTDTLIPPFSVFGVVSKDSDGGVPRLNAKQFGTNVPPVGCWTNGAVEIPANHAGVAWSIPYNTPVRLAVTSTDKPAQGDPCGVDWGTFKIAKTTSFGFICLEGEDTAIANTVLAIRVQDPANLLMEVTTTISAVSGTTLGSGTATLKVREAGLIASSGYTAALPVYNFRPVPYTGGHIIASACPGVGLVVASGCHEHITNLRVNGFALEYKKMQTDCTESAWTVLAPGASCVTP